MRVLLPASAFLVAVAFWPWYLAPALTTRWIVLMIGAAALWVFAGENRAHPLPVVLGILWLAYGALSEIWSPASHETVLAFAHWVALGMVFAVGASVSTRAFDAALTAFAIGVALSGALALDQALDGRAPHGLFLNHNHLAAAGLIGCIVVLMRRGWTVALLPLLLVALVGASWPPAAKTVIVGAAAAGVVAAWARRDWLIGCIVAGCAIVTLGVAAIIEGEASGSFAFRIAIWRDVVAALSWQGHGLGAFAFWFPQVGVNAAGAGLLSVSELVPVAYNDPLQIVAETGLASVLLFSLALFAIWNGRHEGSPLFVFAAVLGLGLVDGAFAQPALAFVAALCAGRLCRRADDVRAGAGDRRSAVDRSAELDGTVGEGLAGAASGRAVSLFAGDPRSEREFRAGRGRHTAADRVDGVASGAGALGKCAALAATSRLGAAHLWGSRGCARICRGLRTAFSAPAQLQTSA
jgi:hypothetical protein